MHASWRIRGIYILIARDRKVKKAAACYSSPSIRILRFIVEIPCPKDVGNRAFVCTSIARYKIFGTAAFEIVMEISSIDNSLT